MSLEALGNIFFAFKKKICTRQKLCEKHRTGLCFFSPTAIAQCDKISRPFCRWRNRGELNGTIPAHLKILYFTSVVIHWASEKQNATQFSRVTPTYISILSLLPHRRPSCWKFSDYLLLYHPTYSEFAQALMKRKKAFAKIQSKAAIWYSTLLHQKTFEKPEKPRRNGYSLISDRLKCITYLYSVFSHWTFFSL